MKENTLYELVIIGTGPAGLTASIYASRYGVKNAIIGLSSGGQISESHLIDNFPGVEDIKGAELAGKMLQHAKKYEAEIFPTEAVAAEKSPAGFQFKTASGQIVAGKAVILATGTQKKRLDIKGEKSFYGKGVSYCATCDGFFQKGKEVAVMGGSDSAAGAAVYLSGIAKKVYLVYRKKELRCEQYWKDALLKAKNIEILVDANVLEIVGEDNVEGIRIGDSGGIKKEIGVSGVFIEAGSDPKTKLAQDLGAETDTEGYIKIKENGATSVEGVWAAGDATDGSDKFRQIITAAAEGAIAARGAFRYLKKKTS